MIFISFFIFLNYAFINQVVLALFHFFLELLNYLLHQFNKLNKLYNLSSQVLKLPHFKFVAEIDKYD